MLKAFTKQAGQRPSFNRRQLKSIALPAEHGVWGFWLEPSLLGLVLAPSLAGLSLVLATLAALLVQQPLMLFLQDIRRQKVYPRTRLALSLVIIYTVLAFALGMLSLGLADSLGYLLPLVLVSPLVLYQFKAKIAHQNRRLLPELLGVIALNSLVASLVLIRGEAQIFAFLLWLILLARSLPSILYVRARLRLERSEIINRWPTLLSSALAVLLAVLLARLDFFSALTATVFLLLFIRAAYGLSWMRFKLKAKHIGMLELAFGLLLVLSISLTS